MASAALQNRLDSGQTVINLDDFSYERIETGLEACEPVADAVKPVLQAGEASPDLAHLQNIERILMMIANTGTAIAK
ncbi:MAG: hypothetical protein ABSB15_18460 [Bryobacteraceae bacterium]